MNGFQVFADYNGNLWVADGWVFQPKTGVRIAVGAGRDFSGLAEDAGPSRMRRVADVGGATFVGGSGRNLVSTGLSPSVSGPELPVGIWLPDVPSKWVLGIFTLTKTGASAAEISDGTNVVAAQTSGSAPVGSYAATAYGKTTYNGGSDFTITVAAEEGAPGGFPQALCEVSAGTAQDGLYSASDAANFSSDEDGDWTIEIAGDGSAELLYLGTAMAVRATGSPCEPDGHYEANAAGMTGYNSGEAWSAFVRTIPYAARAGYVYLKITESGGTLSAVSGPYLATALPADTSSEFHVPLAQSDGLGGLVQYHTGLLLWSGATVPQWTAWEDLRFPSSGINPPGAAADPPRSATTGLLEFAGNLDHVIAGIAQMPHCWKRGTTVRPHLHLIFPTASAGVNTRWKLEVNRGDSSTNLEAAYGSYVTAATITVANPNSATKEVLASFGDLSMTGLIESAVILWRITRLASSDAADTDTSAVVLAEFDIHFQSDKPGTPAELPT